MKKRNLTNDLAEERLAFSFKKEEVSSEKIKTHWDKIAARIAEIDKNEKSADHQAAGENKRP
ncbi:MAG TPA: hypothetical protein VK541_17010 [Pedobacter sp.]|uniref:hypothetical protein n=1 Tax=Pedobacter sp. TaxID=1411316 RepID=UPI002C00985E|nr:hypothetical protein [Pedobacter sp.]HMI04191.1 hypothetical protein [Pedobacter sp.]